MDVGDQLQSGREAGVQWAWTDVHAALSDADRDGGLDAEDLERLSTAAFMLGREPDYLSALERAHHAHLDDGAVARAIRCAFWLGLNLTLRGQTARAAGWLARAQRLLGRTDGGVERGYLLVLEAVQSRDAETPYPLLVQAVEIAHRFGDADLFAIAVHEQGSCLIRSGQVETGLALIDEAMVAVAGGGLSPIATGLIYCSVIETCQRVHDVRRAQEWTAALTLWCDEQPDLVAFTGRCLIHRAELMQLHGAWADALDEARQAAERLHTDAAAQALYRQGELHRVRGETAAAEQAYREASRAGLEPQPGWALLRLAQGRGDAAAAAIRRVLGEAADPLRRAALLPAYVEIMLALGEVETAGGAAADLDGLAATLSSPVLAARARQARGAIALAGGDPRAALASLRPALDAWQDLQAPYECARVRELVGLACRALGDDDSAGLELDAARSTYARLGAAPDLARLDAGAATGAHGLSSRELQVLRLIAAGATNRAIAAELVLSQRTIDRHVSNILAKLRVPSRAAATAYAYEHQLVRR